ncbi:DUF1289 domain-containing protein [Oceanobacter kriegii]|uniref:DUF1289 domain-containing protein n=1 Tax=Oceanobacter kriegii TaxID=64972 RepID=UPI000409E310|nr:DUF1289 domain-containing protein [Oceanobacter kriegii]
MIDQGELFDIPNPCIGICTVNNKGYCKGCLRNRKERQHWYEFSPFQKQLIINLCDKRRQKILAGRVAALIEEPEAEYEVSPQAELFAADAPVVDADTENPDAHNTVGPEPEKATPEKAAQENKTRENTAQNNTEQISKPQKTRPAEPQDSPVVVNDQGQMGLF